MIIIVWLLTYQGTLIGILILAMDIMILGEIETGEIMVFSGTTIHTGTHIIIIMLGT
jgi:hypothetical protein